jgi:hypothetical protein
MAHPGCDVPEKQRELRGIEVISEFGECRRPPKARVERRGAVEVIVKRGPASAFGDAVAVPVQPAMADMMLVVDIGQTFERVPVAVVLAVPVLKKNAGFERRITPRNPRPEIRKADIGEEIIDERNGRFANPDARDL